MPKNPITSFQIQQEISAISMVDGEKVFLEGPAGLDKTEIIAGRIKQHLDAGISGYNLFVLLADRGKISAYKKIFASAGQEDYRSITFTTFFGLANQMVRIFWPLVVEKSGVGNPEKSPVFLTYETAQFLMNQEIQKPIENGFFDGLTMQRGRIVSQLLDNLNKAAVNNHDFQSVQKKLSESWTGPADGLRYFDQGQKCIAAFRQNCLSNNLLDVSLVVHVFTTYILPHPTFKDYFTDRYPYLFVDHLEEMVPAGQQFIQTHFKDAKSALLAQDSAAGYRVFLGIDAQGADQFKAFCNHVFILDDPRPKASNFDAFGRLISDYLGITTSSPKTDRSALEGAIAGRIMERYQADVIRYVAQTIKAKSDAGVPLNEMVVLTPYLDGVIQFSLEEALRELDIPLTVSRRHHNLNDQPVIRAGVTMAILAHPHWKLSLPPADLVEALTILVPDMDRIRASLIVQRAYHTQKKTLKLSTEFPSKIVERIGFVRAQNYDKIVEWLHNYQAEKSPVWPDYFIRRLFTELLASANFDPDQAGLLSRMIRSMKQFREATPALLIKSDEIGPRYIEMIRSGIISAEFLPFDDGIQPQMITLAPVTSWLLSGKTVKHQFWLDIGSSSWWEPPAQPLTNPHVLSHRWPAGRKWTDLDQHKTRSEGLNRMINGLLKRCTEGVYLCASERQITGEAMDSPLLRALQGYLLQSEAN